MLKGKKILLTVGPTREYLDPVRFITNESSGKMGFAIAEQLHKENAELIIVSGPVSIETKVPQKHNELPRCKQTGYHKELVFLSLQAAGN